MADGRPSHVRFADQDQFIPSPESFHRRSRLSGSRRSHVDYVDGPDRYASGNLDGPLRRRPIRVVDTETPYSLGRQAVYTRSSADSHRQREPTSVSVACAASAGGRFTESPPPIDEQDSRRARPRRRSFADQEEQGRFRPRERSISSTVSPLDPPSEKQEPQEFYYVERDGFTPSHRPPSFTSEDWDAYDRFEFAPPSQSVTESSRDDSDLDSPESDDMFTQRQEHGKPRNTRALAVDSSSYSGSAELGGTHAASLTVLHDTKGHRPALFRWLHVRQEIMNFDELWVEVSRLPVLSDVEKNALAKLRADVKRTSVRSRQNPKGEKVGYMDPRFIEVALKNAKEKTSGQLVSGSARWICLPYLSLEQYSGLLAASNLASFPTQTLLQTQYSRNALQRDMEQAVCRLGTAQRGECFHVAQLWCIVLDNTLLVTCGTMSQADLEGEVLKVDSKPSPDFSTASGHGNILVYCGDSVVWVLTAEECPTWFSFISKFQAFWPQNLVFWHKDQILTAEAWPKIQRLATRPRSSVKLILKAIQRPDPPLRAVLPSEGEEDSNSEDECIKSAIREEDFNVLTLCRGNKKQGKLGDGVHDNLKMQLSEADKFLSHHTAFSDRKAFKSCQEATRGEVYKMLADMTSQVEENGTDEVRRLYEERIDIYNAADIVYRLFLPKNIDDPTSRKYWGAVKTMMDIPELKPGYVSVLYDGTLGELRTSMRAFSQDIKAFQNVMSYAGGDERAAVDLPREFVTGWLYVVMTMIYGATNEAPWNSRMMRAKELVIDGMQKIMQDVADKSLLDKQVVLPLEVFSLISLGLLQDQVGKSDDVCETYSQYLKSLETDITSKPSDRSYKHRIDLVNQEITAIKRILRKQRILINCIRNSFASADSRDFGMRYREETATRRDRERELAAGREATPMRYHHRGYQYGDYGHVAPEAATVRTMNDYMGFDDDFANEINTASKLSATDPGGLRGLLFMECSRLIEQREFDFRRYEEYAEELERAIAYKMDWTKDRQENAIFAFTLVTIIFLPMSAVSSIFGMNTADVRDMDANQWLYWVVALPLTLVVIVAGLGWMGELGNIARWVMRKPQQSAGGHGSPVAPQGSPRYYTSAASVPNVAMEYAPPAYAAASMRPRRGSDEDVWYVPLARQASQGRSLAIRRYS